MVMESFKRIGSRFAFEFFLEEWKPKIVDALRKWLSKYTPEDINKMVTRGRFPDTSKLDLSTAAEYVQYIEKISLERLVEDFLIPARPDLIGALQEMGMPGAKWLVKLHQQLLTRLKGSEFKKEDGMVMACCEECGKQWPVKKEEAAAIKNKPCPFCGAGGEKEKETPAEEE